MQVQSISNPSFEGKRDHVDAMINLDNRAIQKKAYEKALKQLDPDSYKKDRQATNLLFYSAPLAAGVSRMLLSDNSKTKLFTRNISGAAGRMAKGLKTAAFMTTLLGAVDLLGAARNKIYQKSDDVKKFDRKYPMLSFMTTLGAGIALITALPLGIAKAGKLFGPEITSKANKTVGKLAKKINNSNTVDVLKNAWNLAGTKTPNWIKTVGAVALDWAPAALLFGGLFNSIRGSHNRTADFVKNYNQNYSELKEKQINLSRARLREISNMALTKEFLLQTALKDNAVLSVQNDLLMSFPENRYTMNVLDDGARYDMPQEVVDKVNDIRANRVETEEIKDDEPEIEDAVIIEEENEIPQDEVVEEE